MILLNREYRKGLIGGSAGVLAYFVPRYSRTAAAKIHLLTLPAVGAVFDMAFRFFIGTHNAAHKNPLFRFCEL